MSASGQYTTLASCYDLLNDGADYDSYTKFICSIFCQEFGEIPGSGIIDLACGTGEMSLRLTNAGFSVLGIDISDEMLTVAAKKNETKSTRVFLTKQDMRSFITTRSYEAVICCYDSLNYITSSAELGEVFGCVSRALCPGGLFIFDMNTLYRYDTVYSDNVFALDYGDVYCVWRNDYRSKSRTCVFDLTFFARSTGEKGYMRFGEIHKQKYHSPKTVEKLLADNGLELINIKSEADIFALRGDSKPERLVFVAKKRQTEVK